MSARGTGGGPEPRRPYGGGVSHRRRLLAAVPLLLCVLTGCSDGPSAARPDQRPSSSTSSSPAVVATPPSVRRYVALGDSFTAAPGVPGRQSDDGCLRSSRNYPHLLAEAIDVAELVDVSCGGAATAHLTAPQRVDGQAVSPQLEALTPDTDLVTVGLGGNDLNLFGSLVGGCVRPHAAETAGTPCTDQLRPGLAQRLDRIEGNVAAAVRRVRAAAPAARVVVVGYPQLVPASGTCTDLPFAPGDYPFARAVNEQMSRAVERGAARAKATYLDLLGPSEGHDICSDEPWVNGFSGPGAIPFHPFSVEQEYVAQRLAALVADPALTPR